ncbi:discoidin domain-containing protein [Catenibacterium sp.]|uniref:galactose-binding domain-containing protein n=1 Tax=Catenibacterium sp. TaxID=2049022 RepID=UPI0039941F24
MKQPKTTNLALNKKSSASSSYKAQYDSSKAFDGSEDATSGKESRWVSLRQKDNKVDVSNQWISVDLGDYYNVNEIKLNWEGTGAEEYKLQVSLDGETWTDITHAQHSNGGIETYNYNGVTARYVKMQGIKPNSIYGYSLWEFEVYGDSLDKCELTNLYYMNVNMDTSIYTPETKERFNQALNNTYKVINENVDSSTILETKQELLDSINNLKLLANFDYLGSLIKECKNLDESVYAPATFEKLKDKLQEAEMIYNDKNSSQEKIDSICEELIEAKDKLIFKSDKTDLIALVDKVNKLDRSLYIDVCVEKLDIYLNKAQEVINDENANEESVLEAYENLSDAKDLLVTKESYEHLQELITKALDIDESKYTEESIKLLTDKRKQAEEAYKESVPQNDKVQKAILELEGALNALEKKIDYSQLLAIISKAESIDQTKYTPSSLLRVNNEVLKAKALIDKADVTQEEIDEMVTTLSETVDHLVLKADKTKLEELISKIDALDMSKYENTDSLIKVLNQSKEVLMNEEATQSEVDQAYEMLNASYKQLKLKSDNIEITEIPTQSTNKTDKNEQIKTGDTTYLNMIGWSLLIMMSCLGIFFIRKRVY